MLLRISLMMLALVASTSVLAESSWDPKQPPSILEKALEITVYRSAQCGCCKDWIDHLKKHNFKVDDVISKDMHSVKRRLGLPGELASCHTGVIGGYIIEGHVPAQDIKQLVYGKSTLKGLSVPLMPHGTPGMETGRKDEFNVIGFDDKGSFSPFNSYLEY